MVSDRHNTFFKGLETTSVLYMIFKYESPNGKTKVTIKKHCFDAAVDFDDTVYLLSN